MEIQDKALTDRIVAAAIPVHKELGPGFLEVMYEKALAIEFTAAGVSFERQKRVGREYHPTGKGEVVTP